jgi:cation:H+ antiporter
MEMDVIAHLFIILISLIILDQASHIAITNSIKVSDITGIGKTTVGFIVLAFSTSLPELSVAFIAALSVDPLTGESQAALSIGNVLGSNIANICLIIGLAAIIVALRRKGTVNLISAVARAEFSSLYFGLFLASVIPLGLIYITGAGWVVGLILLLIFVVYTYQLSKIRIPTDGREVPEDREKLKRYLFFTLIGIFGVIISAYFLVESAVTIARFADVPRALIGATIVAFGTSLPEFSLTVRACLKGQTELGLGNIIGSGFMNITLILGVSLFFPALTGLSSSIDMSVYQNLVVFSLIANLFMWYFLSIGRLSWKEGAIFLFIYLLFLASTLGFIQVRPQLV